MATAARRLPGIRFVAEPPPLRDPLPRMDVAVFAGFAAAGPVGIPVQVEDEALLAEVFGRDLPLAWDRERGEVLFAHLAPAVRAFLRNGGRRAYVLRLARCARADHFRIPGLARLRLGTRLTQAVAPARSEGSWCDEVSVGALLWSRPLAFVGTSTRAGVLGVNLDLEGRHDVAPGDLLRLTFDDGHVLMLFVRRVEDGDLGELHLSPPPSPSPRRVRVHVVPETLHWFRLPEPPIVAIGEARVPTPRGGRKRATASLPAEPWPGDGTVAVDLDLTLANAPLPGSLVRVDFGGEVLVFTVEDTRVEERPGSPPGPVLAVRGRGLWRASAPAGWEGDDASCERLSLELRARATAGEEWRLSELGYHPDHGRFWGGLPTDVALFDPQPGAPQPPLSYLVAEAAHPRFPLAGAPPAVQPVPATPAEREEVLRERDRFIPIGMPFLPGTFLPALHPRRSAIVRNGLATFDSGLFLDADLEAVYTPALAGEADFIRYTSPAPRRLRGMHAAFGLDEATLIAVPDAVHRGWTDLAAEALPKLELSEPIPRPEDWPCCDKELSDEAGRARVVPGDFRRCDLQAIPAPTLILQPAPDPGTYSLTWSTPGSDPEPRFILEEAPAADWSGATLVYDGPGDQVDFYGRGPGDYYYRVRVEQGINRSEWSLGVGHRVRPPVDALVQEVEAYQDEVLLDVHRALLRLSAARGDLFAVLSLPEHYREPEAASHAGVLRRRIDPDGLPPFGRVPPLGGGEERTLSYGALYHPWLFGRDGSLSTPLRRLPPDGPITGVMARRALRRGAWVAPANEGLRGVVDLTVRTDADGLRRMQDAQVNWLRQEPDGFVTLSADTLTDDEELRPLNVRRLLQLLRRLALREGQAYVFEPNDARFRRSVQRGFEAVLARMFERGAFAGRTPSTSFQVVTGEEVNPAGSVEAGRFFVELKVAPSRPLAFLTVRLVQLGDRRLQAEER